MFDIGWPELLFTIFVMILVVGPRELPVMMRGIGRFIGRLKSYAQDFHDGVEEILHEQEVSEVRENFRKAMAGDDNSKDMQAASPEPPKLKAVSGDDVKAPPKPGKDKR